MKENDAIMTNVNSEKCQYEGNYRPKYKLTELVIRLMVYGGCAYLTVVVCSVHIFLL
jgi:hypothetical protein